MARKNSIKTLNISKTNATFAAKYSRRDGYSYLKTIKTKQEGKSNYVLDARIGLNS